MDQSRSKAKLYDPLIASRVRKYLEDNIDKRYVNIPEMIKHLQARYPEYARKKQQSFKHLVHQAYQIVSQELMGPQVSSEDSEQSDLEVMADTSATNTNMMNNMMSTLYTKQTGNVIPRAQSNAAPAVAIDISSDESCDEAPTNGEDGDNPEESFGEVIASLSKVTSVNSSAANSSASTDVEHKGQKRREPFDQSSNIQKTKKRKLNDCGKDPTIFGNEISKKLYKRFLQIGKDSNTQNTEKTANAAVSNSIGTALNQTAGTNINSNQSVNSTARNFARLPSIHTIRNNTNEENTVLPSSQSSKKKYKKTITVRKSNETFRDIGGMEAALKDLCEILMHVKSPEAYFALGLMPPRGILLHGPSGCGKTLLAHAIAGQLDLPICEVPATEFIAGVSGESEQRIREIFEQASAIAPCVLFIDEIDAISSNRSTAQREMERRIVSQLISSMDELKRSPGGQSVLLVGATTRPDVLDPALRRVGRFDHEIAIGVPNRKDRKQILEIICDGLCVEEKCDFDTIATLTPGFVGADLLALVSRAAVIAVKRICTEQLHAFQSKALTIVDLDGDDTVCEDPMETDQETSKSIQAIEENKEENNKASDAVPDVTEETPAIVESQNINDGTTNTPITEAKDSTENVEEPLPEADEEKTAKDNNINKTISDPIEMHDPTLCEMMNLLDNPLDLTQNLDYFCITNDDMKRAVKLIQPSAKREGFITVPDTAWEDIGSLHDIREELQLAVLAPVKYPDLLERLGLSAPSGVLLCGPPGCGKTLLAKAIANEAGINFISVKGPELMNMYVGESERAVRACFQRARNSAPCVIFFDEFDSLCPKRSDGNDSGSGTRIVNQLLTEMDGVEERKGVYVLAATNRPDIIDPAILRPGRLDTILYVGLPQETDRVEILIATTKNRKRPVLADDVDFKDIASKTDGYTGADLAGLVKQASMLALKDAIKSASTNNNELCVRNEHFEEAIKLFRPSVTPQSRIIYEKLRMKYASPRSGDD